MTRISVFCAALLLLGAAPASSQGSQSRLLPVSVDAPFGHAHSGLSLPAMLIGLDRFEVRELEAPQLDVWARYRNDESELTVYVYRATTGSVPVWFDRAAWAVESRGGEFGTARAVAPASAVAVPGAATASALIQTWSVTDGKYAGTSLLIAPLGEWLVKLRFSTRQGRAEAAEEKMREAFAALGWPAALPPAPVAAAIADCPAPLVFKGNAKSLKADGASTLLGALMLGVGETAQVAKPPPRTWCRDAARPRMGGVYRADGDDGSYLLALSDAGRGISVAPDGARALVAKGKGAMAWSIGLALPGRTVNYPSQDRLPSPERVLAVIDGAAVSSVNTWGKGAQINVSSDAIK